jgi:ribosome-binding protein aMBF1 (putative translation factor)
MGKGDRKELSVAAHNKPLPRTAPEPVCEALATVIRQRREARGLSLNELAELKRRSRPMIRFIETNGRIPTVDTIGIFKNWERGWTQPNRRFWQKLHILLYVLNPPR